MKRVVLIGDVGVVGGRYHTGDEAMLGCAVEQLRSRGIQDITVLSANPADTAERYGVDASAGLAGLFEGCRDEVDRQAKLADFLAAVATGSPTAFDDAVSAIRAADSVIIGGGGNLNSDWPALVAERQAVAELCSLLGPELVLTSQSIGPRLEVEHRAAVGRIAGLARVIGVREASSARLLQGLGVDMSKVAHVPDDAFALRPYAGELVAPRLPAEFVSVTFAPHPGLIFVTDWVLAAAQVVREIRQVTGLPVLLVPHEGRLSSLSVGEILTDDNADTGIHARIAAEVGDPEVRELPLREASVSLAVTAQASLVVSTRYHQVINAIATGTPVIGLSVDSYGENKIGGALRDAGLGDWSVGQVSIASKRFESLLDETWRRRDEIGDHIRAGAATRAERIARWWDAVAGTGSDLGADLGEPIPVPTLARARPDDGQLLGAERNWLVGASAAVDHHRAEERLRGSEERRSRDGFLADELAEALTEVEEYRARVENLEAAVAAAYRLAAEAADPTFSRRLRPPRPLTDDETLHAFLNSRTFRWSAGPRRVYSALRAIGRRR